MMPYKTKPCWYVLTGLALMLCMIPAMAWSRGGPPPDPSALIADLDTDGDGMISAAEFKGPEDLFTRIDTDGDGYLTLEELENGRPGPPGPPGGQGGFDQDDADNDGMVSKEEFSGPDGLFDELDADGDGYITREEAQAQKGGRGPRPRGENASDE